jgi:hypothetical protein
VVAVSKVTYLEFSLFAHFTPAPRFLMRSPRRWLCVLRHDDAKHFSSLFLKLFLQAVFLELRMDDEVDREGA